MALSAAPPSPRHHSSAAPLPEVSLFALPPLLQEAVEQTALLRAARRGAEDAAGVLQIDSAGLRDVDGEGGDYGELPATSSSLFAVHGGQWGGAAAVAVKQRRLVAGWLSAASVREGGGEESAPADSDSLLVTTAGSAPAPSASVVAAGGSSRTYSPRHHCALCGIGVADRMGVRKFLRFILSNDPSCDREALLGLGARQVAALLGDAVPVPFAVPLHNGAALHAVAYAHELCLLWSPGVAFIPAAEGAGIGVTAEDEVVGEGGSSRHSVAAVGAAGALRAGWAATCGFCGRLGATVTAGTAAGSASAVARAASESLVFHAPCALLTGDAVCSI